MALVWLPLDDRVIDGIVALAGSSWARAELDDAWVAAGWALPDGRSVAEDVFGAAAYTFRAGDVWVRVAMRFDPDEVVGFSLAFATYADDPDDPDVHEIVPPDGVPEPWSVDVSAPRAEFDARYRAAVERMTGKLGEPAAVGRHYEDWHHAVWRVGECLVVVAQGENFDTYGTADDACLWLARHASDQPVPTGETLYAVLCGDALPA